MWSVCGTTRGRGVASAARRYGAPVAAERLDLRGRVCLVTGAGRGIGLATVHELARRGAGGLVLVDLPGEELSAAAAGLDDRALEVAADVTDADAMTAAVAAARERYGRLDVVVANAGIERIGTVRAQPPEDFERVIEVNLLGVYRTLRPAIDAVVEARGHLIAVSSATAAMASPMIVAYGASKAGVAFDTSMIQRGREHPAARQGLDRLPSWMQRPASPEAAARVIADGIEQRRARVCLPRGVAGLFLLSDVLQRFDDQLARRLDVPAIVRLAESEQGEGGSVTPRPAPHPPSAARRRAGRR
jgi:hypothetical protein